ncbi:hypothetical protein [Desertivirga arenae]|uniref:hypothetical protein n=1 Tax=Desertivirga arenae TaxID=2810309 RepID=UPI001A95D54E|nr:hypothetical protein [Pedobacter sp. SYSU D00823]
MRLTTKTKLNLLTAIACFTMQAITAFSGKAQTTDRVHLGFIYPISTHGSHAPLDTNDFSLHLLAGVSASEKGLAIAGLSNVARGDVKGLAVAGFSNHLGTKSDGLLIAGFANTYGNAKGMQFAGFANVAAREVEGAQYAGFINKAGDMKGVQAAGFINVAREVTGIQLAGFLNTAKQVKGSQIAGFGNASVGDVSGSQLSGFFNHGKDVAGSQIAGFVNIARKVKGAQIAGFINIADSSDCPIGIINIIRNGEKSIGVSIDETETTLLSFRSGGKILYGIIGGGFNWTTNNDNYAIEAGLGAHFFPSKVFRINTELASTYLGRFDYDEYYRASLRFMPSILIGKHLELNAGPSLNYINTNNEAGKTMVKHYFHEHQNRWDDNFQAWYIGYKAGLNFKF